MISIISSSGTRSPRPISAAALTPKSVRRATCALRMLPVATCGTPRRSLSRSACVPFPLAGAPNRSSLTGRSTQNLGGDSKGRVGGGHSAIDGRLQQDLLDLIPGHPVVQRAAQVQHQLLVVTQGDQHPDRDAASRPTVATRPVPDLPPRRASKEFLELLGERGSAGFRAVDVGVAQDLPSHLHAALTEFIAHWSISLRQIPIPLSTTAG